MSTTECWINPDPKHPEDWFSTTPVADWVRFVPARPRLTIEEINALPEAGGWWPFAQNDRIMRLIRAIERAHGVKT